MQWDPYKTPYHLTRSYREDAYQLAKTRGATSTRRKLARMILPNVINTLKIVSSLNDSTLRNLEEQSSEWITNGHAKFTSEFQRQQRGAYNYIYVNTHRTSRRSLALSRERICSDRICSRVKTRFAYPWPEAFIITSLIRSGCQI